MSEPFLAEIRIVGFNFVPRGWAFCDGQILPIVQNQSLFALIGTMYGGDGRTTFALPDLRGRVPIHVSEKHRQGNKGGVETQTLSVAEMPAHAHQPGCSREAGNKRSPVGNIPAAEATGATAVYSDKGANADMNAQLSYSDTGGGQAHENMQPWLALNYCIALQGMFPSRN